MIRARSESDSSIDSFIFTKYFDNTFIWEKMCFPLRFRKINKDIILYPNRGIWLRKVLDQACENSVLQRGCT